MGANDYIRSWYSLDEKDGDLVTSCLRAWFTTAIRIVRRLSMPITETSRATLAGAPRGWNIGAIAAAKNNPARHSCADRAAVSGRVLTGLGAANHDLLVELGQVVKQHDTGTAQPRGKPPILTEEGANTLSIPWIPREGPA